MMRRSYLTVLASAPVLLTLGAVTRAGPRTGTFSTDPVRLGGGEVRAYIVVTDDGPEEVGVALTEQVLDGLPHEMVELVLPLPADNPTPYRLATVNWNPHGHEPPGMYDLPHFDFHFFVIGDAERRRIDPTDPLFTTKAANYPPNAYIPRGYVSPFPEGIPLMGVHWIDPAAPELNGQPFTRTLLYGSWDGRMIFVEPMVTKSFLESRADVLADIPVAERHRKPGAYPGQYRVHFDSAAREYRVALRGFAYRE